MAWSGCPNLGGGPGPARLARGRWTTPASGRGRERPNWRSGRAPLRAAPAWPPCVRQRAGRIAPASSPTAAAARRLGYSGNWATSRSIRTGRRARWPPRLPGDRGQRDRAAARVGGEGDPVDLDPEVDDVVRRPGAGPPFAALRDVGRTSGTGSRYCPCGQPRVSSSRPTRPLAPWILPAAEAEVRDKTAAPDAGGCRLAAPPSGRGRPRPVGGEHPRHRGLRPAARAPSRRARRIGVVLL